MRLFGSQKKEDMREEQKRKTGPEARQEGTEAPKAAKPRKTWFHMPRWAVICGAAALLSVAGVVAAKELFVVPPPVIPAPPIIPKVTPMPYISPEGADPEPTPTAVPEEESTRVPLGDGLSIGRLEGMYTILVVGTDGTSNTDTIMVARLDVKNSKLNVMSIPRDTQVNVRRSMKKINAAWAAGGYGGEGINLLKKELKTVIGFVPDYYVLVDLNCFVQLVDAIGGVWFDVPRNMNYDDRDQNLHIHLEKGWQQLNGEEAIQLVRFRKNNNGTGYLMGDIERVELHHDFLKAVAGQTLQLGNLFKIPEFVSIAQENLDTDLEGGYILWFVQQLMKLKEEDIAFYTLPVASGALYREEDYALVKERETLELVNETINPYIESRRTDDLDLSWHVDSWRS